jgi:hypothetical protein
MSAETVFIASWADGETLSSLTESTPNKFSHMLSQCSNFDCFYMDIWTKARPVWTELLSRVNAEKISRFREKGIAGHRHRGRCRWHRHSGILYISPIPEHSGTGLDPLIPVPDWFHPQNFCSFRYRTDWMPGSLTFRHLKKLLVVVVVKGKPSASPNCR